MWLADWLTRQGANERGKRGYEDDPNWAHIRQLNENTDYWIFFFFFYKFFPTTFRNISCCCPTVEMKSSRKKWRSKNDRLCQIAESREVKGEEKRKWHSDMKTVERWNWDVTTGEVQIRQIQADKGMIYQLIIKNDNDQRRGSLCEEWIVETNRFETCLIVENAR